MRKGAGSWRSTEVADDGEMGLLGRYGSGTFMFSSNVSVKPERGRPRELSRTVHDRLTGYLCTTESLFVALHDSSLVSRGRQRVRAHYPSRLLRALRHVPRVTGGVPLSGPLHGLAHQELFIDI